MMYTLSCHYSCRPSNKPSQRLTRRMEDRQRGEKNVSPFPLVLFLLMCVSALVRVKSKQVLLCDMSENQKRLERYMEVLSNGCRCAVKPESSGWWDIVSLCPGIWATSEYCSVQIHFRELKLPTHTPCNSMAVNMVCQIRMRNCLWRFVGILQQLVNSVTWFSYKIKPQSLGGVGTSWRLFT